MNENSVEMRIFYPDGNPGAGGVVRKEGATATAVFFSRESCEDICKARENKEFLRQCVYVLWGAGAEKKPRAYIGISDNVRKRMYGHLRDKKFWTRAMVYTDGDRLGGDAEYIEARLVQIVKESQGAGACVLDNTNEPRIRTYDDEAKHSAAEKHVLNLCRFFLPLAGCDFLNPALVSNTAEAAQKPMEREEETGLLLLGGQHKADDKNIPAAGDVCAKILASKMSVSFTDNERNVHQIPVRVSNVLTHALNYEEMASADRRLTVSAEDLVKALVSFGIYLPRRFSGIGSGMRGPKAGPEPGNLWVETNSHNIKDAVGGDFGSGSYANLLRSLGGEVIGRKKAAHESRYAVYMSMPIATFFPEYTPDAKDEGGKI